MRASWSRCSTPMVPAGDERPDDSSLRQCLLDVTGDLLRLRGRRIALHHRAVGGNPELGEVPLDAITEQADTLRAPPRIERVRVRPGHVTPLPHLELAAVVPDREREA